jgi:hypothetical protein
MSKLLGLVMVGVLAMSSAQASGEEYDQKATLEYITKVFRDTQLLRRSGGITTGHMAQIFENAANRLEFRDDSGVAEDVVDWAYDTAKRFRNVALMFRDIGMRASVAGNSSVTTFNYAYFGYYAAWWRQTYTNNSARRVATYDAGRFKWTQYYAIREAGANLRRAYR